MKYEDPRGPVPSMDPAVRFALEVARERQMETVWDRYRAMQPQCGFGELGLCCRFCLQGPCRIDPFGNGPTRGICGATADAMVARHLDRAIAAGTAAHAGHARHIAMTLRRAAEGHAPAYPVKDAAKLQAVAARLGIATGEHPPVELAAQVAHTALSQFGAGEQPVPWAAGTVTAGRVQAWAALGALPDGIDSAVSEVMHRTSYGTDSDPVNLLLGGLKCSLADYASCSTATDLSDILFGTPQPVVSAANMGVLRAGAVNVAVHGHNPLLSDLLVAAAADLEHEAQAAGAEGVNLVGVCCTGNEVLMRHGVPMATHSVSQETLLMTGAVDAMVVDYQCVMPAIADVAACFGTPLITTMEIAKIPGAIHMPFAEATAQEDARAILRTAIKAFGRRRAAETRIPDVRHTVVAGFSVEAIVAALSKLNAEDPLKPVVDNIVPGNIQGVALLAGCNNVRVPQDRNHLSIARELLRRDVLVLATGCAAGALGRHGLLDPAATDRYAGPGLRSVLHAIGTANGLAGPLPPVLHMGSCVDNSRAVALAVALANYLGVDLDKLPVVASAPEAMHEKAVAIGTWAVALGLPTHVGVMLPVLGGSAVTQVLTNQVRGLTGGYFIVELDPEVAARKLFDAVQDRRRGLGLTTRSYEEAGHA